MKIMAVAKTFCFPQHSRAIHKRAAVVEHNQPRAVRRLKSLDHGGVVKGRHA
jgi:hypothetical protein